MFYDHNQFPYLNRLVRLATVIKEELLNNRQPYSMHENQPFVDTQSNKWAWENGVNRENIGYDLRNNDASMLCIYKTEINKETYRNTLFPETLNAIKAVPNVHYAAFTFLNPHGFIAAHKHNRSHMVFHILLNDLSDKGCKVVCGNETLYLKKFKDCMLFDYSEVHETKNLSNSARINLMIDFTV